MLSFKTQSKLASLFQKIAENERKIEVVRQVLAEQRAFEPYTAFRRIDRNRNGFLTITDLEKFLLENDIVLTYRDLFAIHKNFDINGDGRINYSDFNMSILPKEDLGLKDLACSRKSYPVESDEYLSYEVEWALARVFEQEALNFRTLEILKEDLAFCYDFNLVDAFNLIDEFRRGYISVTAFDKFMKKSETSLSDEEIDAFFRVVDVNEDGRISYSEFVQAILPEDSYNKSIMREGDYRSRLNYSSVGPQARSAYYTSPKKRTALDDDLEYQKYKLRSLQKEREFSPLKTSTYLSSKKLAESSANKFDKYETPQKKSMNKSAYGKFDYGASTVSQYKSPIKEREQEEMVKTLKDQIEIDKSNEQVRKDLALRADYNLLDGFRFFDLKSRGFITSSELERGLEKLGIFPTKDEIYLVFRRYDKDSDGLLKYSDFCKMITPQNIEYAKLLNERSPLYNDDNDEFDFQTKRLLTKVFRLIINGEVAAESLRQKLQDRPYFSIHEAFNSLDFTDKGFITYDEFKQMLEDYGIYATKSDLLGLMKRYDGNMDGKVSYSEFMNELTPKSPQKYYKY